jgi:fanconi anemia group J protein
MSFRPIRYVDHGHGVGLSHAQLWAAAWACGPSGRRMTCTFQHLNSEQLQDDIGGVVLQACQVVPFGVLVFVPSYGLLDKLLARWQATGLWAQLAQRKTVVVEPHGSHQVRTCRHG